MWSMCGRMGGMWRCRCRVGRRTRKCVCHTWCRFEVCGESVGVFAGVEGVDELTERAVVVVCQTFRTRSALVGTAVGGGAVRAGLCVGVTVGGARTRGWRRRGRRAATTRQKNGKGAGRRTKTTEKNTRKQAETGNHSQVRHGLAGTTARPHTCVQQHAHACMHTYMMASMTTTGSMHILTHNMHTLIHTFTHSYSQTTNH